MGAELAGGAWGEVRQGPAAMGRGEGAASGCAGARTSKGCPRPHMPITSCQHCTKTAPGSLEPRPATPPVRGSDR